MSLVRISVRAATAAHIEAIVRCHIAAFPGQTMTEMGPRWLSALYSYYLQHPQGVSVVAVDQADTMVGFTIGGGPGIRDQFIRQARWRFPHVILWRFLRSGLVRRKLFTHLVSLFKKDDYDPQAAAHRAAHERNLRLGTLLSIGVMPQAQGSGAAGRLIEYFCDVCQQRGFGFLELGVYTSNARAIAFYKKHGWHEIDSSDDQTSFGLDISDRQQDKNHVNGTGRSPCSIG